MPMRRQAPGMAPNGLESGRAVCNTPGLKQNRTVMAIFPSSSVSTTRGAYARCRLDIVAAV